MSPEVIQSIFEELVQTIFYLIPYGLGIFGTYISTKVLIKIFKIFIC